jgi:multidrug efflux system outer membrane protein
MGGSLVAPLIRWNQLKRTVDVEQSRAEQARLAYEQTALTAFRDVEDALVSISTLKTELIARQQHVTAALRAQELSQERYDQGATSYLEYLESQRQAFEAQQNYAGTKQQLLSSYAQLYKALGGGWVIE